GRTFRPDLKGLGDRFTLLEVKGFREMDVTHELQRSLGLILEDEEKFAASFYANMFRRDESLRLMFHGDMRGQGRMMTHMLTGVVYGLSRPEYLLSGLEALGRNHVRYGVKASHYPIAREAFMETVLEVLGDRYTPQVEE